MLAVALIIGQMTAGLRYQARIASYREERARSLYEFSRDLSSLLQTEQVVDTAARVIAQTFRAEVAVMLPDDRERVGVRNDGGAALAVDIGAAQWAYDNTQPAGMGTDTLAGSAFLYLPLRAPMRTRGVIAIKPQNRRLLLVPEQTRQLDTFAALAAIALERVHYVEVAQQALIQMESERLRNSLLSALSHDVRTPLAALIGLAESLPMTKPALAGDAARHGQGDRRGGAQNERAGRQSARHGAYSERGGKLRREWLPLEEVVGSALKSAQAALVHHRVDVALARGLAARRDGRHADRTGALQPSRERRQVHAAGDRRHPRRRNGRTRSQGHRERPRTRDSRGPGGDHLREVHARRRANRRRPGVGLGLAISRAIVEAHRGRIWAENNLGGGAKFSFTLPLGTPPAAPTEPGETAAA